MSNVVVDHPMDITQWRLPNGDHPNAERGHDVTGKLRKNIPLNSFQ